MQWAALFLLLLKSKKSPDKITKHLEDLSPRTGKDSSYLIINKLFVSITDVMTNSYPFYVIIILIKASSLSYQ